MLPSPWRMFSLVPSPPISMDGIEPIIAISLWSFIAVATALLLVFKR